MNYRSLESSVLAGGEYDADKRALKLKFKSGAAHTYYDVPQTTTDALFAAKSPGAYFGKTIRGQFSTRPPRARRARR